MNIEKILIVGSGAREHALSRSIIRSDKPKELFCIGSNNNPGIMSLCSNFQVANINDPKVIMDFAKEMKCTLAIIGPENPLGVTTEQAEDKEENVVIESVEDPFEKIKKTIIEKFPNEIDEGSEARYIYLKPDNWLEIAKWIQSEPSLLFNSLQCQMGIDMGEDILESRYNFHSMEHDHYLEIRIRVSRSDAKIPSVEQVWRIADWFERETYDMLGIEYTGHRDLRRILLPDDWEGWPLRKDYQEQETYHGIVVPKIKEGWD